MSSFFLIGSIVFEQYLIVSIRSQELSLNGLLQNNILLYQSIRSQELPTYQGTV
jgi:hypothetical protein